MEHPITPPPELVQQWDKEAAIAAMPDPIYIATKAARWGADQELEACCEWIHATHVIDSDGHHALRAARRSKPPEPEAAGAGGVGLCELSTRVRFQAD